MTDPQQRSRYVGYCDTHNKRLFANRDAARKAIRLMQEPGMRPYRCDLVAGLWHIGHLAPDIRRGLVTAPEVYGR